MHSKVLPTISLFNFEPSVTNFAVVGWIGFWLDHYRRVKYTAPHTSIANVADLQNNAASNLALMVEVWNGMLLCGFGHITMLACQTVVSGRREFWRLWANFDTLKIWQFFFLAKFICLNLNSFFYNFVENVLKFSKFRSIQV